MFAVGLAPGDLEAQQGDDRGTRVREVVESVGGDGDGVGEQPRQILGRKQKYVQTDAHRAAEHAVDAAHARIIEFVRIVHQYLCQKTDHVFPSVSTLCRAGHGRHGHRDGGAFACALCNPLWKAAPPGPRAP